MLHGVKINNVDTLTQYGLLLCADLKIGAPKTKTNRVDIPGGDGSLNMSYSPQGCAVFQDREISFTLFKKVDEAARSNLVTTLRNLYHGQTVELILPNDLTHYWRGMLEIGDVSGYGLGQIPVTMIAEPYKYKTAITTVTKTITDSGTITLANERAPVVPTITTSAAVTIAWDGYSVAIGAGTQQIPQLVLPAGDTVLTITGSADITITYREGSL